VHCSLPSLLRARSLGYGTGRTEHGRSGAFEAQSVRRYGMYCPVQYSTGHRQSSRYMHSYLHASESHGTSTVRLSSGVSVYPVLYCTASPTGHPHSSRTLAALAEVLNSVLYGGTVQHSRGDGSNAPSHRPCGPNEPKPKPKPKPIWVVKAEEDARRVPPPLSIPG
jgi:hypothetical protein